LQHFANKGHDVQCELENFTPLKFVELYFSITENFKAIFYTHARRSSLCQIAKFPSIIFKFDEIMPQNFPFSPHIYLKTQTFDI